MSYRKKDGRKGKKTTTRRVVPSHEMSIEDFDAWKARLTEEAHDYFNKDKRETRENVPEGIAYTCRTGANETGGSEGGRIHCGMA